MAQFPTPARPARQAAAPDSPPPLAEARPLAAAAWMAGAIVAFSAMAVAGREVQLQLDTFEVMLYRSLVGVALVLSAGTITGRLHRIAARRMPLHTGRNIAHFTGQNLWFFALTAIPLAQVFALEFTSPIFVALLAPLFLGEALGIRRMVAVGLGFAGILIVARPGVTGVGIGQVAALGAAACFGITALFTKRLTRTEPVIAILFWLTVLQTLFALLCAGLDGSIAWPSAANLPLLGVIGVAGLAAHMCLTTALGYAPAVVVMPLDFLRLPVIALVGMALYAEPLEPAVFVGAGIVLAGVLVNLGGQRRTAAA